VTLKLRTPPRSKAVRERLARLRDAPPDARLYLSRAEHAEIFGARPRDVARVEAFAAAQGLSVVGRHLPSRLIRLRGRVDQVERAFGVKLRWVRVGRSRRHAHREEVRLPAEIAPVVRAVLGLDSRPLVRRHAVAADGGAGLAGFPPREVCRLYGFPAQLSGAGQCLAIIEVNAANTLGVPGAGFRAEDLAQALQGSGLPVPAVEPVPTADGTGNFPDVNPAADAEVALDVQVAAAAAPGARFAVYFGSDSPSGYHDAVLAAIHDTTRNPRVIATSWGAAEDEYPPAFLREMDQLFQEAGTLGITICASAGDLGSAGRDQGAADQGAHPHFPATSPSVLACGGTSLTVGSGGIAGERVWNGGYATGAGGGGVSEIFPRPAWQPAAVPPSFQKKFAGRGIPDLAAHADQANGYRVVVAGETQVLGGTSAVAPLLAGFLTGINQSRAAAGRPPLGLITPQLYAHPQACRDLPVGTNDIDGTLGLYQARPGWDPCTGLGAPDGAALLALLS
jgi:kumamolisin